MNPPRHTHRSVKELAASITHWGGTWNDEPRPYVWRKTADETFESLTFYCQRISDQDARTFAGMSLMIWTRKHEDRGVSSEFSSTAE
jgi:hypothetical protein